jgi:hypothetical protein
MILKKKDKSNMFKNSNTNNQEILNKNGELQLENLKINKDIESILEESENISEKSLKDRFDNVNLFSTIY